jgi:hypothetical protein
LLLASAALAGCDVHGGFSSVNEPTIQRAMQGLDLGIVKAKELLKAEFGICDMSVLVSGALMVPLIVALGGAKKITAQLNSGLALWVAWAALSERYAQSSGSRLREDISAALQKDPVAAILKAVRPRTNAKAKPEDFERPFQNKFALLATYIATGHVERRDFLDGTKLTGNCAYEWHHIMPKATLRNTNAAPLANTVANLAFIKADSNRRIAATPAHEYLPNIPKNVRSSHCIPDSGYEVGRAEQFWDQRRKALAKAFNAFVESHA